jgi:hypothetical protein
MLANGLYDLKPSMPHEMWAYLRCTGSRDVAEYRRSWGMSYTSCKNLAAEGGMACRGSVRVKVVPCSITLATVT